MNQDLYRWKIIRVEEDKYYFIIPHGLAMFFLKRIMSTMYTKGKVKIDHIHNKIMDGTMCYVGLALAGGILAVLLGVGWYGDRMDKSVSKRSYLTAAPG